MSELAYKRTNVYEIADEKLKNEIFSYAEDYRKFIDEAKTEREACALAVEMAKKNGYRPYALGEKLKAGDKVYFDNRGKNLYLLSVGTENLATDGVRILASHIDSPRLDLKQVPLYEKNGIAFGKTHYYGGIRKYQWSAIPLALHGTIVKADGTSVNVKVGEDESDPVFCVSDLLPHLAARQNAQKVAEAFPAENLNVWLGNIPYSFAKEKEDQTVKENLLQILYEKYGVCEADFLSAELCLVPAFKCKDVGFDRGLLAAYGHDDRVCAYPSLTALFSTETKHTVMVVLADKEEVGSDGPTSMQGAIFTDLIDALAQSFGVSSAQIRATSKCLSADVATGYDPNFPEVFEAQNSTYVSCGVGMYKYTGSRGKVFCNDTTAEFLGFVRKLFDENGVVWQTGELGKTDEGGGGTVARFISKYNVDTVDIGVPVVSMHSPYELISKADLYETHLACKAFIK